MPTFTSTLISRIIWIQHIPKEKRIKQGTGGKLTIRGWDGIFVGYDWKTLTGYLVWDPLKQKARKIRYLIFDERRVKIENSRKILEFENASNDSDSDAEAVIFNNSVNHHHAINFINYPNNSLADHTSLNSSPQTPVSNKQAQGLLDTNTVNENFSNTRSQSRINFQNNITSLSPVEKLTISENVLISSTFPSSQFKNKTAKFMAERALRKEQKLDAEKAWKSAHRA
ncbi:hypothetical protein EV44_g5929 [Erysiphe necator]|uniref:Retroviral polymerase SH3-like domain-containing protein n=1 Tax=Uncinula necator TaxID=52586 RepID=A0A0B1P235_UNCNE|nr:hypothetical protein EV44_g5929 [Erysiphe necator]